MGIVLMIETLNHALGHRQVEQEQVLIHLNQGSQYRTAGYRNLLR